MPAKLGRYEIVKHLANGGMAQVLIARATGIEGFERHVVLKRINGEHKGDPAFVQMFLDEARTAAALHHNNIVQVHDIGKDNGEYFFAMEYVHGQDLRMLLKEASRRGEKVPWEHVVTVIAAAAAGLHHAHELRGADRKLLGLVHRDVSPANILIGYDGTVKVVDFGIAKAALRTGEGTNGGALKGKAAYMAPEQCTGKAIDRRSDVYALGVVLYELSTVRRLFKGATDFATMSAIVAGNIPPPASVRPDMPSQLVAIIMKALSLRPEHRYQTADEMREALELAATELALRTSTGTLGSYMKHMFGAQPEPWLVQEEAELELTVDFDGSASGVAPPSSDPDTAVAGGESAPIERARRRITEPPPMPPLVMPPLGPKPAPPASTADGSGVVKGVEPEAPTMTVVPVRTTANERIPTAADIVEEPQSPLRVRAISEPLVRRRNRMPLIAGGIAAFLAVAIAIVLATRGGQPQVAAEPELPPTRIADPPPNLDEVRVVEPPPAPADAGAAAPVATPPPPKPAVVAPPKKRPVPPPKKKWNPDGPFLPKRN